MAVMSSHPSPVRRLGPSTPLNPGNPKTQLACGGKAINMRKLAYLVGLFVLATLTAAAQESKTKDVSVEYSYVRANPATTGLPSFDANGGTASFAFNPRSWVGFAGEFGEYHVGQVGGASVDTNLMTYMVGPQFYFHRSAAL